MIKPIFDMFLPVFGFDLTQTLLFLIFLVLLLKKPRKGAKNE